MDLRKPAAWAIAAAALALGVLAAFATLYSGNSKPKFEGVDVTGVLWGSGFELTDHHGKRRTLADFRGKVVTLFFGYTHCPDMCPLTLAKLGEAMRRLGRDAEAVQGFFVDRKSVV